MNKSQMLTVGLFYILPNVLPARHEISTITKHVRHVVPGRSTSCLMHLIIRNVLQRHPVDLLMEVRRNDGWPFAIVLKIYQIVNLCRYEFVWGNI